MIQRYYQEEMRYLHEAGKAFAKAHPNDARLLNIDSVADRDPYVERLFEGFAFLTARIHERLDDELPEYTEGLLSLLWPQLLHPVPAFSLVEFHPTPGLVQQTTTIPRGTEVWSSAIGEERTVCRFMTTQDVSLQPFRLVHAALAWPRDDASTLTLRFRLDRGIELARLTPTPVRLQLHADSAIASLMYLFLTRHVDRVVLRPSGKPPGVDQVELDGRTSVKACGFGEDEALLPYSAYSLHGFRLLQEYLAFRQKFWSVELSGLDQLQAPPKMSEFEVELQFDRAYPENKRFGVEQLRLFTTPVVNLFRQSGDPVRVDHRSEQYRIIADARRPTTVHVYDVDRVVGVEDNTGRRHEYAPYFTAGQSPESRRWFTTTRRAGGGDRPDVWLTLGGAEPSKLRPEKLSLELWCTNGNLPRGRLVERTITTPPPDLPRVATFENLTQPTQELSPPGERHRNLFWRLISHLSLSHRSLATRDGLVDLLSLYDWTAAEANTRRIAGIRNVTWEPKEIIRRRAYVRGAAMTVEVQEGHFADDGDLCLFGAILSRALAAYATINSFVHLTLVVTPSGKRFEWKPQSGTSPLL